MYNIIQNLIFDDIFGERSKICDQGECIIHNKFILNIKYIDLILPNILIFNFDLIDYNSLNIYKNKIDKLFEDEIVINKANYKLVGIIFHKNKHYYMNLSLNLNNIISDNKKRWLFYDDLKRNIQILDNKDIGYNNIRKSNIGCLFVYLIYND